MNDDFPRFSAAILESQETVEPDTESNRSLMTAIRAKDREAVKSAFAVGADPNAQLRQKTVMQQGKGAPVTHSSSASLYRLIESNSSQEADNRKAIAIFREFVDRGLDVCRMDMQGYAIIHSVVQFQDVDLMRLVLDKGADVQAVLRMESMDFGNVVNLILVQTLRHKEEQTLPVLQLVLERGASPNLYDSRGMTPLHCAASSGYSRTAALLLEYGADQKLRTRPKPVNGINVEGTALELAQRSGDLETIRVLAAARKDMTPVEAAGIGHTALIKNYLESGGDPDQRNAQGMTLLHLAAASGNVETVRLLLDYHAEENSRTPHGTTPLHQAAARGFSDVAALLLKAGADSNALQGEGNNARSALFMAVRAAEADMVALLLEHGARIRNPKAVDLLEIARRGAAVPSWPERLIGQSRDKKPSRDEVLEQRKRIYQLIADRTKKDRIIK